MAITLALHPHILARRRLGTRRWFRGLHLGVSKSLMLDSVASLVLDDLVADTSARGYLETKDTKMNKRLISPGLIFASLLTVVTGARNARSNEGTPRVGKETPSLTATSAMSDEWYESCPWIWTDPDGVQHHH
jgi:hypothetical protein